MNESGSILRNSIFLCACLTLGCSSKNFSGHSTDSSTSAPADSGPGNGVTTAATPNVQPSDLPAPSAGAPPVVQITSGATTAASSSVLNAPAITVASHCGTGVVDIIALDRQGNPAGNVQFTLDSPCGQYTVTTPASGRVQFTGLSTEVYELYGQLKGVFTLQNGSHTTIVEKVVSDYVHDSNLVHGQVVDSITGQAVGGATISLCPVTPSAAYPCYLSQTNAAGAYSITVPWESNLFLSVQSPAGYVLPDFSTTGWMLLPGAESVINFHLRKL